MCTINGKSRILKWRYVGTICQAIFWRYIPIMEMGHWRVTIFHPFDSFCGALKLLTGQVAAVCCSGSLKSC